VKPVEFGTLFQFIRNGMNVKQDKSGDGLPITRIETISEAMVDGARVGYADLAEADCRDWLLEAGDILLSHINSVEHIGKCAVYRGAPEKLVHGMNLLCLRSDTAKLLPEFAKYLIRGTEFRTRLSNFINKAVNQASVSIGNLKTIPVTVPPLAEQRRIAEVLDRAEALRAKRRAALAQLDSLAQSILQELLRNCRELKTKSLEQIARDMHQGINTVTEKIEYKTEGYPIIQSKHITQGYLDLSDARFVNEATFAKYKDNYSPEKHDLLLCNIGTIGKSLLMEEQIDFLIAWNLFLIKLNDREVLPCYCKHFFDHLAGRHYFDKFLTGGTVKFISKKTLGATPIQLPPIGLQREFVRRVGAVEKLKAAQRASLAELDALFATLQHRAFRGEL
jgi:type I restriction enzyme, S subunit